MDQFRFSRGKSGRYFLEDTLTRKQISLRTHNQEEAERLLAAHCEAARQPLICLQIARTYMSAADPTMATRTWQTVMDYQVGAKQGSTQHRWEVACKDKAFNLIRKMKVVDTRAQHFWKVLNAGTVSTNTFLRRLHNFALDMNWLLAPIIPKRQWPTVRFGEKRAIMLDEHQRIGARETNTERKKFYELAWYLGASQSDLANLHVEDIDWPSRTVTFHRLKLRHRAVQPAQIRFGKEVEAMFLQLPRTGALFPYLCSVREADRAAEFRQRFRGLGISGVALHSYRYAWSVRLQDSPVIKCKNLITIIKAGFALRKK
jgi:integrase